MFDFLTPNYYESLETFVGGIVSGEIPTHEEGLLGMIQDVVLANPEQKPYFVKRVITELIRPHWDEFMRVNAPDRMTTESIQVLMTFPEYLQRKLG